MKDPQNKDKLIWDDEEIKKLHADSKLQSCSSCGSVNCRILYRMTSDPATKKRRTEARRMHWKTSHIWEPG